MVLRVEFRLVRVFNDYRIEISSIWFLVRGCCLRAVILLFFKVLDCGYGLFDSGGEFDLVRFLFGRRGLVEWSRF